MGKGLAHAPVAGLWLWSLRMIVYFSSSVSLSCSVSFYHPGLPRVSPCSGGAPACRSAKRDSIRGKPTAVCLEGGHRGAFPLLQRTACAALALLCHMASHDRPLFPRSPVSLQPIRWVQGGAHGPVATWPGLCRVRGRVAGERGKIPLVLFGRAKLLRWVSRIAQYDIICLHLQSGVAKKQLDGFKMADEHEIKVTFAKK